MTQSPSSWRIEWSVPQDPNSWYVAASEPASPPRFDPPGGHYYGFQASSPVVNPSPYFFWLGRDAEGFHART